MPQIFYYGLYMDPDVRDRLAAKGVGNDVARLDGWAMRLGERSTLEPKDGAVVWGVVVDQTEAELKALYPERTHIAYQPTPIAVGVADTVRDVITYVAPAEAIGAHEVNYARALAAFCRKLDFPDDYVAQIK